MSFMCPTHIGPSDSHTSDIRPIKSAGRSANAILQVPTVSVKKEDIMLSGSVTVYNVLVIRLGFQA